MDLDPARSGILKKFDPKTLNVAGGAFVVLILTFLVYSYVVYRTIGRDQLPPLQSVGGDVIVDRTVKDEPVVRPTALPDVTASPRPVEKKQSWLQRFFGSKNAPVAPSASTFPPPEVSSETLYALSSGDAVQSSRIANGEFEELKGSILEVLLREGQIRVAVGGTTVYTVKILATTRLFRDTATTTISDLQSGNIVTVRSRVIAASPVPYAVVAEEVRVTGTMSIPPAGL